ncbi:hypothetical protein ACRRTK_013596 [Alexandromys fortis]
MWQINHLKVLAVYNILRRQKDCFTSGISEAQSSLEVANASVFLMKEVSITSFKAVLASITTPAAMPFMAKVVAYSVVLVLEKVTIAGSDSDDHSVYTHFRVKAIHTKQMFGVQDVRLLSFLLWKVISSSIYQRTNSVSVVTPVKKLIHFSSSAEEMRVRSNCRFYEENNEYVTPDLVAGKNGEYINCLLGTNCYAAELFILGKSSGLTSSGMQLLNKISAGMIMDHNSVGSNYSHTRKQEVLIHILHQGCEISDTIHATGNGRNTIPSREEQRESDAEVPVFLQLACKVCSGDAFAKDCMASRKYKKGAKIEKEIESTDEGKEEEEQKPVENSHFLFKRPQPSLGLPSSTSGKARYLDSNSAPSLTGSQGAREIVPSSVCYVKWVRGSDCTGSRKRAENLSKLQFREKEIGTMTAYEKPPLVESHFVNHKLVYDKTGTSTQKTQVAWMLLPSGSVAPISSTKAIHMASSNTERKMTRLLRGAQVIPKMESNYRIYDSFRDIQPNVLLTLLSVCRRSLRCCGCLHEQWCSSLYVIHTVGPIARGHINGSHKEDLANCYQSSLKLVKENNLRSVDKLDGNKITEQLKLGQGESCKTS